MKKLQVSIDDQIYKMMRMYCTQTDVEVKTFLEDLIFDCVSVNQPEIVDIVRSQKSIGA